MRKHTQLGSIEQYEKEKGKITLTELIDLKRKMVAAVPRPRVEGDTHIHAARKKEISIPIVGMPLNDIDLYKGKLVKKKAVERRSRRVIAAFRGNGSPVIANGRYDPQKEAVELTVPDQARSGAVLLSFPLWMSYSGMKQASIKQIIADAKIEHCVDLPLEETYLAWLPVIGFYGRILCGRCGHNSICPNGAIKFDDNDECYVDQEICKGQSSEIGEEYVGDRYQKVRVDEEICWECLAHECPGNISKVLFIDSNCCGCCHEMAQVIEGLCLANLCSYGAIESRYLPCDRCPSQTPGYSPDSYSVDQGECTGCMDCYENLACSNVKMKARIRVPCFAIIVINTIRFREIRVPSSPIGEITGDWNVGLWWEREGKSYHEEIPIDLDERGRQCVRRRFQVHDHLHIGLFSKSENRAMIPVRGNGHALRPSMVTVSIQDRVNPVSTRTVFNTEYGDLEINYRTSPKKQG